MCQQIIQLNHVLPQGLVDYIHISRKLIEESIKGVNTFDSFKPVVPRTNIHLHPGEDSFDQYEAKGLQELGKTCFVLIAGGIGERLGYSGIKIDLPVSIIEKDYSYLKYYTQFILACQQRAKQILKDQN